MGALRGQKGEKGNIRKRVSLYLSLGLCNAGGCLPRTNIYIINNIYSRAFN